MSIFSRIETKGSDYTIKQVDLSFAPENTPDDLRYLYEQSVVDYGEGYLGHPDSVLLKNGDILTFFPKGHGKGAALSRRSTDGGVTFTDGVKNPPKSWEGSRETPTVYRLEFNDPATPDKLLLVCGNPKWGMEPTTGGFNCSISDDEGETWTEFELFCKGMNTIVAMASLTRLKENGKFVDKWMALFHDSKFHNYKTILTFDKDGRMQWSEPEKYFSSYRRIEKGSNMCEVECVRSDAGKGDEICLLTRSNTKKMNSLISFSRDEGKTWSKPVELPAALNGERHKADYLPDGRLIITFRSIERDPAKNSKFKEKGHEMRGWYSEGWIAWVGTYDDLKNGGEGQYRIKLAHTYLGYQDKPDTVANSDCGYCGNVVLSDGTFVTSTYGIFTADEKRHTYIVSKRLRLDDVEKLL
ncbi:MAG: exo-alpha-sialidase [Clostridia bacterium]|nr:exo-alpha-sialidase [Clostridia bacterium]